MRGVEVGNIFKLGTRYSDAMGCTFLDEDGSKSRSSWARTASAVGRLLACVAEEHHDEHGLIWPITVAPYQVHLVALAGKGSAETQERADALYEALEAAGVEVLYDDREESPGVKFNDADLIGLPLRLTVSERAHKAGGVELEAPRPGREAHCGAWRGCENGGRRDCTDAGRARRESGRTSI